MPISELVTAAKFHAFLRDFAATFSTHEDEDGDRYTSHDAMAADLVRRHPVADRQRVRALIAAAEQVYAAFIERHTETE
jgi:ribosomal 50S subunit-associated protein YjgA (DUF615 family)